MHRTPSKSRRRRRVGRVTVYERGHRFWVYYRQGGKVIRRAVGSDRTEALSLAARVNAELAEGAPTSLAFRPVEIASLIKKWLDHHEQVRRSSLSTVRRYRTAIQYLGDFVTSRQGKLRADRFTTGQAEDFVRHLRTIQVAPNGHPNAARRALRDKGVVFVLQACRALFGFAAKQRHLPAYAPNPFSLLAIERIPIEDAKPIRPLTPEQEIAFFQACDAWQFPIFFVLAFTGLRVGELTHLLVDHDLCFEQNVIRIANKPRLFWQVKTRNLRQVPLLSEVADVLRRCIGKRKTGPVFLRRRLSAGLSSAPLVDHSVVELEEQVARRVEAARAVHSDPLSRSDIAKIARSVWQDAGAIKETVVRTEFMKVTAKIGLSHLTCPKDLRHLFATSLQAAGVDPMIRRDVMGHTTLEMTSHYTHTQNGTRLNELHRLGDVRGDVLQVARRRLTSDVCSPNAV